jgi:hypothetical protein
MPDRFVGVPPGPDGSDEARAAYQQAYCEHAMQEHSRLQQRLYEELRAKIRYEDCERALSAFKAVFSEAQIEPWDGARANFAVEAWDLAGFPEDFDFSDVDGTARVVWDAAIEAGRVELCDKAPFVSVQAFALVDFLDAVADPHFKYRFPLSITVS